MTFLATFSCHVLTRLLILLSPTLIIFDTFKNKKRKLKKN